MSDEEVGSVGFHSFETSMKVLIVISIIMAILFLVGLGLNVALFLC
jgi:hypothetical protein